MKNLSLSPFERVVLINQFEIRKALSTDKDDIEWHDRTIEILINGYEFYYPELIQRFEVLSAADSDFVFEVLQMYRRIEHFKEDHPDDKEVRDTHHAHFAGFDGNNESKLLGFVRFLFKQKTPAMFEETHKYARDTDGFNSHWPMADVYGRMLTKLQSIGSPIDLSRAQVIEILAEAKR